MIRVLQFFFTFLICLGSAAQENYWQQRVNFRIDVTLNDQQHALDGFALIDYTNNSPDTLSYIWFHCWPNAYRNDQTAFSDQLLENGDSRFYFSEKKDRGYMNRLQFRVNDQPAKTEDHPSHIDIIKLILPEPLPPGSSARITTPFHVKLPENISRGGHSGQHYQATQWYPKPAVYDANGWHPLTYLDQGEFYSEFGDYDVRITVPEDYVVASTGVLQNESEIEWLRERSDFSGEPDNSSELEKSTAEKTLQFIQQNVHDFAWFASRAFIVKSDTCVLPGGKTIDIFAFYTSEVGNSWDSVIHYTRDALRFYSGTLGTYPYHTMSVVQGPEGTAGGMEYPAITLLTPGVSGSSLDLLIAHETGHNWFYGALASNERKYPWMDEGMNSYYENRYRYEKYGTTSEEQAILLQTLTTIKKDQPINTAADEFSFLNYGAIAYYKAAQWMHFLDSLLGRKNFDLAMKAYFEKWKNRHPQPQDFRSVVEKQTGQDLGEVFSLLEKKGPIPGTEITGHTLLTPLQPGRIEKWINRPDGKALIASPLFGYNMYDGFMVGGIFTNYSLPPAKLRFLIAPFYATRSKTVTGIARLSYVHYSDGPIRKTELSLAASTFSMDAFRPPESSAINYRFSKMVPSLKLELREADPRSTRSRWIQLKSFFVREDLFNFSRDTVISGIDTTIINIYGKRPSDYYIHRLKLVVEDYRVLYPYRGALMIDQGKGFIRTALTGEYYFNYPGGDGLQARLFAGKFFYTEGYSISKEFNTYRYHLNMSGPNGYEDYTYSDYFLGRNEFEGFASQQMMKRDGFFKMRTDLLANKVGRSDNWLLAMNLSSHIPDNINPLNLLPVKIPIRIYLDLGTYAEAWEVDAEGDRFLYNAGLHLPLLKGFVNVYLPLIYSPVYKDYIRSTLPKKNRLLHTISFQIDVAGFNIKKYIPVFAWL